MAVDHNRLRSPRISDLIAEPEVPSFISSTVERRACGTTMLVTQDPQRTSRQRLREVVVRRRKARS